MFEEKCERHMRAVIYNVFSEQILIKSQARANEKWCNGGAHDVKIEENLTECTVGVEETIYLEYGIVHRGRRAPLLRNIKVQRLEIC